MTATSYHGLTTCCGSFPGSHEDWCQRQADVREARRLGLVRRHEDAEQVRAFTAWVAASHPDPDDPTPVPPAPSPNEARLRRQVHRLARLLHDEADRSFALAVRVADLEATFCPPPTGSDPGQAKAAADSGATPPALLSATSPTGVCWCCGKATQHRHLQVCDDCRTPHAQQRKAAA